MFLLLYLRLIIQRQNLNQKPNIIEHIDLQMGWIILFAF